MRWKQAIGIVFWGICMVLTGCQQGEAVLTAQESTSLEEPEVSVNTEQDVDTDIYVYVCGYVEQPGVYELPADARICDALALAGGVSEEGRPEVLNQAEHMEDGQTIYVPGREEAEPDGVQQETDGRLNLNTATREELMTLPGIGEAKADSILQYREEHGGFQSIEQLMEIQGIKEGVFQKIQAYVKTS
ncbi:MAG: helix-hairpin-helix domain-containing protein [Lachnospiraceae bacterium]|nr:helix-hairpin-helix domain-containing protein [Lachnospiraceae bacterium]